MKMIKRIRRLRTVNELNDANERVADLITNTIVTIIVIILLAFFTIMALCNFKSPENNHNLARVNAYKGVYIFLDNRPVAPYEELGKVEMIRDSVMYVMVFTQLRNMVAKTKQDYPTADGLMMDYNLHRGTAIKFK